MKKKPRLPEDPVVEEVRSIRADLWAEAGGTVEGLIRLLDERERSRNRSKTNKKKRTAGRAP